MSTRLFVSISMFALLAAACSATSDPVETPDTAADTATDTEGNDVLIGADNWELLFPDAAPEVAPRSDAVPDTAGPECAPGEGCFLDPCDVNADCLSGWCVTHMGEGVCTRTCQEECPSGWTCKQVGGTDPDLVFVCVSDYPTLCRPCSVGDDCEGVGGAKDACLSYGAEGAFCGGGCADDGDCPWGFSCEESETLGGVPLEQCVADSGVCPCTDTSVALGLWTACAIDNEWGTCEGKRICSEAGLSGCDAGVPGEELCNGLDDDCDGDLDEDTCDDGNPCTEDACGGAEGCEHVGLEGGECLDGNACTVADHCEAGVCVGQLVDCDDGDPCTDDLCSATGGCDHPLNADPCDDGNPCTVADECVEGACVGVAVGCDCLADADCAALEDGDLCNGTLVCDTAKVPYHCAVDPDSVILCPEPTGDDAFCLQASCEPGTGACAVAPDKEGFLCDDGDACTLGEACVQGACVGGQGANCNDGNPCTDDDCAPLDGCVHAPNALPCNDGDVCTTADACVEGACQGGPALGCDDGNPCTDDACDADLGCISSPNQGACDDGNPCTTGDHCVAGTCTAAGADSCDDQELCTTDSCVPTLGCVHVMNTVPCDDGDVCTLGDICTLGTCAGTGDLACDDGNPCTDDGCVPDSGCQFTPNAVPCDDGSACTAGDVCAAGWCAPGAPIPCDDGNVCTQDSCDPAVGCVNAAFPDGTSCSAVNDQVVCVSGACVCQSDCVGKVCGPDGCGGSCGVCGGQDLCILGACVCQPDCVGKLCGTDGCGGSCGVCGGQDQCVAGACVCQPDCVGKDCGPDGCGGDCGPCPDGESCQGTVCAALGCGDSGIEFAGGCIWTAPWSHTWVVPQGVTSVTVTMIGGGGGGGSGYYYMGGGGGSGYYAIDQEVAVTPGETIAIQVGNGGAIQAVGGQTKFGALTVNGGSPGKDHGAPGPQSSALGGDGGTGGGAGYTNTSNGGGHGSGVPMGSYAGQGGMQSPGTNQHGFRGEGFGAGGAGDAGQSGYSGDCGGKGGTNGGDGETVGPCGGGGGGAGGLVIIGFSSNPGSSQVVSGQHGVVYLKY